MEGKRTERSLRALLLGRLWELRHLRFPFLVPIPLGLLFPKRLLCLGKTLRRSVYRSRRFGSIIISMSLLGRRRRRGGPLILDGVTLRIQTVLPETRSTRLIGFCFG